MVFLPVAVCTCRLPRAPGLKEELWPRPPVYRRLCRGQRRVGGGRGRLGGQRLCRDGRQHGREHNTGGVRCGLPQRKPGERDENFGVDSG